MFLLNYYGWFGSFGFHFFFTSDVGNKELQLIKRAHIVTQQYSRGNTGKLAPSYHQLNYKTSYVVSLDTTFQMSLLQPMSWSIIGKAFMGSEWFCYVYVPFFISHSFAFRRTWPRHGELFEEGGRFRAAALFTGIEHSVSLVSQLEMGEFSNSSLFLFK